MRALSSLLLGVAVVASSIPAVAATSRAERAEAQLAKALNGRVAGKPVNCISLSHIYSTQIIDHKAILYQAAGGRTYVNTPRGADQFLDDDDILVTNTFGSDLCRLDTIRLLDRGTRFVHGFIALDEFVPYTKVKN